jgi:hypothetical protein
MMGGFGKGAGGVTHIAPGDVIRERYPRSKRAGKVRLRVVCRGTPFSENMWTAERIRPPALGPCSFWPDNWEVDPAWPSPDTTNTSPDPGGSPTIP